MDVSSRLHGIESAMIETRRIRSHVLSSGPRDGSAVVFLHGNLSSATFFEELMLAMPEAYRCIAPDLRGYGDTEDLPIDATRGVRDTADDLQALLDELGVESAHITGWSAGAGIASQFMIEHTSRVQSLTLIAPVSPYGFGGTCDTSGTPCHPDYAGSGGGTANSRFVDELRSGNRSNESPTTPLSVLRNCFVNPPFQLEREAVLLDEIFKQKLGERRYPGDHEKSDSWPHVSPGRWGPLNALSPKYFDTSIMAELADKPPILWVRGTEDTIISDHSLFDLYAEQQPQPMVSQTAAVLDRYANSDGIVQRETFEGIGHAPFLEDLPRFVDVFAGFVEQHDRAGT